MMGETEARKREGGRGEWAAEERKVGDDLRSQELSFQVPSALAGLTAGFEKGPGVPPPLETPTHALFDCTLSAIPLSEETRVVQEKTGRRNKE